MTYYTTEFQTKINTPRLWKDEDILTITKVADVMWEYRIKSKIKELKENHKDYKTTIKILEELLKNE